MVKNQLQVVVLLMFVFLIPSVGAQQDFKGSVGVRFGYGIGIAGTYTMRNNQNIEFLLRYGYHGLILNKPGANIQALYEKHWQIRRSNFTAYVGAGPCIGVGKRVQSAYQTYFSVGASPIIGFDYTTQQTAVPFIFALDYKPTFLGDFPLKGNQKPSFDFSYYEIAFSVKVGIGQTGRYRRRR